MSLYSLTAPMEQKVSAVHEALFVLTRRGLFEDQMLMSGHQGPASQAQLKPLCA